jgi:tetratricopeptide (TPR) repeat protein
MLVLGANSALAGEADKYDADGVRGISRFMEAYAKATAAQREKRTEEAIALVRQAVALQPKNPLGHLALAELQLLAGRREGALAALDVAEPLTGSRDVRMRSRVLVLRAIIAEKSPSADPLAAWLTADGWVTEMNVSAPERANVRMRVEAHEKMRGQKARDEAVKARILEGEAKAATP